MDPELVQQMLEAPFPFVTTEIKIQSDGKRVNHLFLQASLAYDNSIVLLEMTLQSALREYIISHISQTGQLTKTYKAPQYTSTFSMLTDQILLSLNFKQSIHVINLRTQKESDIKHKFLSTKIDYCRMFIFSETKLFCISEQDYDQMKLTYYSYVNGEQVKVKQYYQKRKNAKFKGFRKLNNHSKIGWHQATYNNHINFCVFDLKDKDRKDPTRVSSATFQDQTINMVSTQDQYFRYEISPNNYLIKSSVVQSSVNDQDPNIFRYFVLSTYQENNKICGKVEPLLERRGFNLNSMEVSGCFGLEDMLVFVEEFKFKSRSSARVVYMNMDREVVCARGDDLINTQYMKVDWRRNTILKMVKRENQPTIMTVIHCELILKDIFMQFLLHLNEDFDDDLLQDAISLMI